MAASRALALWSVFAACAASSYAPYPVHVPEPLVGDAFARCRETLLRHYGSLRTVDEADFRLQTDWAPVAEPPGERRATVFRDDAGGLAVVVELRRISDPMVGLPSWTAPRGWAEAERELAEYLRAALAP